MANDLRLGDQAVNVEADALAPEFNNGYLFAVTGTVAQTQAPASQQVSAKESKPDEEMLLLLIA